MTHPLQAVLALIATLALSHLAWQAWSMGVAMRPTAVGMTASAILGWWLLIAYVRDLLRGDDDR